MRHNVLRQYRLPGGRRLAPLRHSLARSMILFELVRCAKLAQPMRAHAHPFCSVQVSGLAWDRSIERGYRR
jgi:hypothetical protein